MMDSDDDDIYPEYEVSNGHRNTNEVKMEEPEEGEEEGEEVEDDSDVSSWQIANPTIYQY